jgi:hypothetical protein
MLNSDPVPQDSATTADAAAHAVLRSGAIGGLLLAGLATAVVIALWFAFYFLVFVPRAGAP